MSSVSAIILTYNEEKHLKRCLESVSKICEDIIVVDSYSTDQTKVISEKFNVKFVQNNWTNYSTQLNWAIKNVQVNSEWILRIDADEYLTDGLIHNLKKEISNVDQNINGFTFNRLMFFMDKPLKRGGMYPISHLRIWRNGFGHCEQRWMDERIILKSGSTLHCIGDLIDYNLNDITWWTNKHNHYATREAIDFFNSKYQFYNERNLTNKKGRIRRNMKSIYNKLPFFVRPFIFFFVRYFLQLGLVEGKRGFIWSILQCFWYRMLVDVKIIEVYLKAGRKKEDIIKYFFDNFNYDITKPS
jgi:glycosyltransferase involved in cell wall biosynthesis